jgi:hypothetical protein
MSGPSAMAHLPSHLEQAPRAAELVSLLEHGVTAARKSLGDVRRGVDAGQAGADNQDIEMRGFAHDDSMTDQAAARAGSLR